MPRLPVFILLCVALLLPTGLAQAAGNKIVFGNLDASECYRGAQLAHMSVGAMPACNRALSFQKMRRRERAATLVNRGILHTHQTNFDAAISDFDHALRLLPGFPEARLNRGNAFLFLNEYDLAVREYNAAIEGETREPHAAYYNRGLAREAMKQPRRAYDDFRRAAELRPAWALAVSRIERYAKLGYGE